VGRANTRKKGKKKYLDEDEKFVSDRCNQGGRNEKETGGEIVTGKSHGSLPLELGESQAAEKQEKTKFLVPDVETKEGRGGQKRIRP